MEADLDELTRAAEMIELERLRRIAEIDRRGSWARDGYLSVTAWVADRHRPTEAPPGTRCARLAPWDRCRWSATR